MEPQTDSTTINPSNPLDVFDRIGADGAGQHDKKIELTHVVRRSVIATYSKVHPKVLQEQQMIPSQVFTPSRPTPINLKALLQRKASHPNLPDSHNEHHTVSPSFSQVLNEGLHESRKSIASGDYVSKRKRLSIAQPPEISMNPTHHANKENHTNLRRIPETSHRHPVPDQADLLDRLPQTLQTESTETQRQPSVIVHEDAGFLHSNAVNPSITINAVPRIKRKLGPRTGNVIEVRSGPDASPNSISNQRQLNLGNNRSIQIKVKQVKQDGDLASENPKAHTRPASPKVAHRRPLGDPQLLDEIHFDNEIFEDGFLSSNHFDFGAGFDLRGPEVEAFFKANAELSLSAAADTVQISSCSPPPLSADNDHKLLAHNSIFDCTSEMNASPIHNRPEDSASAVQDMPLSRVARVVPPTNPEALAAQSIAPQQIQSPKLSSQAHPEGGVVAQARHVKGVRFNDQIREHPVTPKGLQMSTKAYRASLSRKQSAYHSKSRHSASTPIAPRAAISTLDDQLNATTPIPPLSQTNQLVQSDQLIDQLVTVTDEDVVDMLSELSSQSLPFSSDPNTLSVRFESKPSSESNVDACLLLLPNVKQISSARAQLPESRAPLSVGLTVSREHLLSTPYQANNANSSDPLCVLCLDFDAPK